MPTGPKGQKRPADVIGNAVRVMQIATGEKEEVIGRKATATEVARSGGKARAERLPAKRRSEIAKKASNVRWRKKDHSAE